MSDVNWIEVGAWWTAGLVAFAGLMWYARRHPPKDYEPTREEIDEWVKR